jgi:hypothetical protein
MSRRGIIYDRLKGAWAALTAEQRICWHFTAAQNPSLNASGELTTENGWQWFVDVNSPLAVIDEGYILDDPPTTDTDPEQIPITVALWPIPSKLAAGGSTQKPAPLVTISQAIPAQSAAIVTQSYDRFKGAHLTRPETARISLIFSDHQEWLTTDNPPEYVTLEKTFIPDPIHESISRTPRVRHVTTMIPAQTGNVPLDVPQGYFATTNGVNRFATIKGRTAARRPDLPLGRLRVVNLTNGKVIRQTIPNPTGTT